MKNSNSSKYTFHDFLPLILVFALIITLTCMRQYLAGYNALYAMSDFMGFFFLIFGAFKILNLKNFVDAYQTYDIIAQQTKWYAYAYPFIELFFAFAYLSRSPYLDIERVTLFYANIFTLVLMTISSIGVLKTLLQKKEYECACLGAVFKLPLTYVTLFEDLLMAGMALYMLYMNNPWL